MDLICIYFWFTVDLRTANFYASQTWSVFSIYIYIYIYRYIFIWWSHCLHLLFISLSLVKYNDLFTPQNTEWCFRTPLRVYCNTTDVWRPDHSFFTLVSMDHHDRSILGASSRFLVGGWKCKLCGWTERCPQNGGQSNVTEISDVWESWEHQGNGL